MPKGSAIDPRSGLLRNPRFWSLSMPKDGGGPAVSERLFCQPDLPVRSREYGILRNSSHQPGNKQQRTEGNYWLWLLVGLGKGLGLRIWGLGFRI